MHRSVNLGFIRVVDDDGMLVPVVHAAAGLTIRALARRVNELDERVHSRQLTTDDLMGGTFTVLGAPSANTLWSEPIIIQPQVAVLSLGAVREVPVVVVAKRRVEHRSRATSGTRTVVRSSGLRTGRGGAVPRAGGAVARRLGRRRARRRCCAVAISDESPSRRQTTSSGRCSSRVTTTSALRASADLHPRYPHARRTLPRADRVAGRGRHRRRPWGRRHVPRAGSGRGVGHRHRRPTIPPPARPT